MSMKMQINGKIVHKSCGRAYLAPGILKFSARSRCAWLYNLDALPVGKSPRYPLSRRLGEPHSRCGHFVETSTARAGNRTTLSLSYGGLLTLSLGWLRYPHCLKSKGSWFDCINTANQGKLMTDEARCFKLQRLWLVYGISPSYISFLHPPFIHSLLFKIFYVFILCHVQFFYFFTLIPRFLHFLMFSSISFFSAFLLRGATTEYKVAIFELLNWFKHQ
jgi:hypothetical protein